MNYFYVCTGLLHLIICIQPILSASVRPGTTSAYHPNGNITIDRPPDSEKDDLLFLFLSRTDDALPIQLNGWVPVASCLKKHNDVKSCMPIEECDLVWKGYCYSGPDLGTVVFYRKIIDIDYEPPHYHMDMDIAAYFGRPAWAILTVSV